MLLVVVLPLIMNASFNYILTFFVRYSRLQILQKKFCSVEASFGASVSIADAPRKNGVYYRL